MNYNVHVKITVFLLLLLFSFVINYATYNHKYIHPHTNTHTCVAVEVRCWILATFDLVFFSFVQILLVYYYCEMDILWHPPKTETDFPASFTKAKNIVVK